MDSSLKLISKEFGFKISEKRNRTGMRFSVSKTWKAATYLASRPNRPPPESPPSQQVVVLPSELLDHILDYLHDDGQALRNCSLACHALVPSARFHLFQKVKVNRGNFVRATTIFAGSTSHLAEYVRDLSLELGTRVGGSSFDHLRTLLDKAEIPVLLRVFMLVLSPRMRNVTRLILKDVPFDRGIVAMLAPNFPQLHTLSLFDCWFHCNADFDTLLRDHPLVRHLRCGRLSSLFGFAPMNGSQDADGPPLPLHSLKITEAYSPSPLTLMPWLVTHSDPDQYTYTLYRLDQVIKLQHCLLEFPSLKHLHIIFYHWRTEDVQEVLNVPAVLSLIPRNPPTVTTLTLDARMHSALQAVTLLGWLDPHSFVRLHTVNVLMHLREEDVTEVPPEMWGGMDQTLSVLLSLGAVNVFNVCQEEFHIEDGKKAVLERLPVLGARGVLKFNQVSR
ncbi:hypothetical protein LXA43DRAFT_528987 [Ganoderma leucocontextum]|nr:hypothetical protein LXA43DRAFT_528987 [Ganoderma leucocontextum]